MSHSEIQGENACVVDMHNVSSPQSGSMLASLVCSDRVASLGQRQADCLLSLKLKKEPIPIQHESNTTCTMVTDREGSVQQVVKKKLCFQRLIF